MSYSPQNSSIKSFVRDIVPKCYLPAIQRELVWNPEKIEDFLDSILRGFPFGTLLLWNVKKPAIHKYSFYDLIRIFDAEHPHNNKACLNDLNECYGILDGQQRTTALNLGLKGQYRMKLPKKWWGNPNSWVVKKLYMNMLHSPVPNTSNERTYEIEFLSDEEAHRTDEGHYWYTIGNVLSLETEQEVREWRRNNPFRDSEIFEDNLNSLWAAFNRQGGIAYFLEDNQDLNEVLTIFVRLNMGGEKLSHSDLLLSLATANWKAHDARKEIYELTEKLNQDCGGQFAFDKDFVLKALLVLNDKDLRFRAENVQLDSGLEDKWDKIKEILPLAVKLTASFSFSDRTLTAKNVLIPIVYYLTKISQDNSFLISKAFQEERNNLRLWIIKMLLGRVFGGQSDDVLRRIREVLKPLGPGQSFPSDEITQKLVQSQNLFISKEAIQGLIEDADYKSPLAFLLLSLITPVQLDPGIQYHVDHIHPKSHFEEKRLKSLGMPEQEIEWVLQKLNALPNLQLLSGPVNQQKLDMPYDEWLLEKDKHGYYREMGLIPEGIDLKLTSFRAFYEARCELLLDKLMKALGVQV